MPGLAAERQSSTHAGGEQPCAILCRWTMVCVLLCVLALIGLATLQYIAPREYHSVWSFNRMGVWHFREVLFGGKLPRLGIGVFELWFRSLLLVAWISYVMAVVLTHRGGALRQRVVLGLMLLVAIVCAMWWPAAQSCDGYAYVGYARMKAIHGLNPYVHSPETLISLGDPVADYARTPVRCPYGPLWTLVTLAFVKVLGSAGLWWQVILVKLIGAGALVVTALTGRRIADHFSPGRGDLTLLAIGLNPLFIIEGPGNGHNDLFMVCLLLVGTELILRQKRALGNLAVGLSVAVKYIAITAVPFMLLEHCRDRTMQNRTILCLGMVLLVVSPTILLYVPFWQGTETLGGLRDQWEWNMSEATLERRAGIIEDLSDLGTPGFVARAGGTLATQWQVILAFLGLSFWLYKRPAEGRWMTAWIIISGVYMFFSTRHWFPWYLAWSWAVSLTRWDRLHTCLSILCLVIAAILTVSYSVAIPCPPGIRLAPQ